MLFVLFAANCSFRTKAANSLALEAVVICHRIIAVLSKRNGECAARRTLNPESRSATRRARTPDGNVGSAVAVIIALREKVGCRHAEGRIRRDRNYTGRARTNKPDVLPGGTSDNSQIGFAVAVVIARHNHVGRRAENDLLNSGSCLKHPEFSLSAAVVALDDEIALAVAVIIARRREIAALSPGYIRDVARRIVERAAEEPIALLYLYIFF